MRVFLSWSGEQSHQVALALKEWLPSVIQALDTWVSSADIEKGEAWFGAISESLVRADGVGVFCLTKDNLRAPWLAYEAGAIASQDRGRVATFLHKVNPSDVLPPLGLFQATKAESKEDVLLLLTSLNGRLPTKLSEQRLLRSFESNWTALEEQLNSIEPMASSLPRPPVQDIPQMLMEVLNVVKRIERDGAILRTPSGALSRSWASGFGSGKGLLGLATAENPGPGLLGTFNQTDNEIDEETKVASNNKLAELLMENNALREEAKGAGLTPPKHGNSRR